MDERLREDSESQHERLRDDQEHAGEEHGRPGGSERSGRPPPAGATVLVVEDEPFVREMLRRMLIRHGYPVLVAANPVDALAVLAEHTGRVKVMVTDVVMPQMSGGELAARATGLQSGGTSRWTAA